METFAESIAAIDLSSSRPKHHVFNEVIKVAHAFGMIIDDIDLGKPWGFYIRFESNQADTFVREFFPGVSVEEARLGDPDVSLSPKFLLVEPGEMFSWQYHDRRAEQWAFLTEGYYFKSPTDEKGVRHEAHPGDVVQFAQGERHQMVAPENSFHTFAAEIWQHTDPNTPSDEADIVRLQDKYRR